MRIFPLHVLLFMCFMSLGSGTVCSNGYYCLVTNPDTPIPCPPGYTSNQGATSENECFVARGVLINVTIDYGAMNTTEDAFRLALPSGTGVVTYEDELMIYVSNCPAGYWCPALTGMPQACPAGTYQPEIGADSPNMCLTCPEGNSCTPATSTPTECPSGWFNNVPLWQSLPGVCQLCYNGFYCTGGNRTIGVDGGFYIPFAGAQSMNDAVICPTGCYCPAISTSPTACPSGTYNNFTGMFQETDCILCGVGGYCPRGASVGSSIPTPCPSGTFNQHYGSVSIDNSTACPSGSFCLQGAVTPTACPPGTYSDLPSSTECKVCPIGFFCGSESTLPQQCPAGTFQPTTAAVDNTSCTPCDPGFYCPSASTPPVPCVPGTHRDDPAASHQSDCILCLPGTFATDTARSTDCPPCPINSYCPTSSQLNSCPAHTTSAPASYSVASCTCDGGYDCAVHREIRATIRVNVTYNDFSDDVGGVKTAFINAVAQAAHVRTQDVTITSILEARRLRRLLAYHADIMQYSPDKIGESLRMQKALKQAISVRDLRKRMNTKANIIPNTPNLIRIQPPKHSVHNNRKGKHG